MQYPPFFDLVPRLRMYDPLAEFLGAAEGGIVDYGYLDAVRLAGHSCPTVASAYWITCRALRTLYPDQLPERGGIRVELRRKDSDGVAGVVANVASLLTGAGGPGAFKGLGGRFDRRQSLLFEAEIQAEMRFTRLDSMQAVDTAVNLQGVPSAARTSELLPKCLGGSASPAEQQEFRQLWQARVQAVLLDYAEDDQVYRIQPIMPSRFVGAGG